MQQQNAPTTPFGGDPQPTRKRCDLNKRPFMVPAYVDAEEKIMCGVISGAGRLADLQGLLCWRSAGGGSVRLGSSWRGDDYPVRAENLVHVMRPGDIR